jgi:hypothetical protein
VEYVERRLQIRNTYFLLLEQLREKTKKLLGRSGRKQEDNIKIYVREMRREFVQRIRLVHGSSLVEPREFCTESSGSINVMNSFTSSEIMIFEKGPPLLH